MQLYEYRIPTPQGARDFEARLVVSGVGEVLTIVRDVTEQKRAEEALRQSADQQQIIRLQAAALQDLATPLIPISSQVLALPLVGAVDTQRAQQVIEALLRGVEASRAHTAILDITGVPLVDTQVANALLTAAQAVRLLGAQVILTGIRPEVAQTLVGLGVDLTGLGDARHAPGWDRLRDAGRLVVGAMRFDKRAAFRYGRRGHDVAHGVGAYRIRPRWDALPLHREAMPFAVDATWLVAGSSPNRRPYDNAIQCGRLTWRMA